MGDEAAGEPRVERLISVEHENQTALDGSIVWKALVEAGKAFEVCAFSGKALTVPQGTYAPLDDPRWWSSRNSKSGPMSCCSSRMVSGSIRLMGGLLKVARQYPVACPVIVN
jgi:hypothetical protein